MGGRWEREERRRSGRLPISSQRINSSTLNSSTHQRINASAHQRINASTHQLINASTHQLIATRLAAGLTAIEHQLKDAHLETVDDLRLLSSADLTTLGLPLGPRNRLVAALSSTTLVADGNSAGASSPGGGGSASRPSPVVV